MSRLLVYSVAHCRAWGLDPRCGNVGCNAQIGDVNSQPMRGCASGSHPTFRGLSGSTRLQAMTFSFGMRIHWTRKNAAL